MYVAAKAFHEVGYKSIFLMDSNDTFPFSQPAWEDCKTTLKYSELIDTKWNQKKWDTISKNLNWAKPGFCFSPNNIPDQIIKNKKLNLLERILLKIYISNSSWRKYSLYSMPKADIWIVCGIDQTIIAFASGKPYVIWPHGGDIRFASGYGFSYLNLFNKKIFSEIRRWLLKRAYRNALFIGSHDPKGIGGHVFKVKYKINNLPLPLKNNFDNFDKHKTKKILKNIFKEYGIDLPDNKFFIFLPSRIDYFWKGTDQLISAIKKSAKFKRIHFIFSGWGKNYWDAKNQLLDHPVTFLPFVMSKPILLNIFKNVDLVIDQFKVGTYGTSLIEAISCGTPVMAYIEKEIFYSKNIEPPPVINACNATQISDVLKKIELGTYPLEEVRNNLKKWFLLNHDQNNVVPRIASNIVTRMNAEED